MFLRWTMAKVILSYHPDPWEWITFHLFLKVVMAFP